MDDQSNDARAFEPAKYLTKVQGRDYLEVKWRLVWLRSVHPGAQIKTELVQHQNHQAVFRADVTLPPQRYEALHPATGEIVSTWFSASATGWGSEANDDFGDYLEKAETKALGRALASLGFGTQFCPDYDFGADAQRVVDSPVDVRGARGQRGNGVPGRQEATPRQIKYLHAVAREVGISGDELEERCEQQFGCGVNALSRRDVSTMIEQVQSERALPGLAS